jgi:hypothetical protein
LAKFEMELPLPAPVILQRLRDRTSEQSIFPFATYREDTVALVRNIGDSGFSLSSLPTSNFYYYSLATCSGEVKTESSGSVLRFRTRPSGSALMGVVVAFIIAAGALMMGVQGLRTHGDMLSMVTPFVLAVVGGIVAYTTIEGARVQQAELTAALRSVAGR